MWAVVTIMPNLETDFETARSVTSLPFTLNMIGFAVGNLIIGQIIDRFGVIISVIAAAVTSATAYYLASQTQSFHLLTAFHLLLGFGTAAGFGPLISDISHWFLKHRGIAVALIASGIIWQADCGRCFVRYPTRTELAGRLPDTSCSDFNCDYTPHLAAAPPPA